MKTPAWRNRAQQRQARGFQPQGPPAQRDSQRASPTQPPAQSDSSKRGVRFNHRPRLYRGKENGKETWSYMVDTAPDGTPQWVDEDPEDQDDDDYAP